MKLQAKLILALLPMVVLPLAALGWISHAHLTAHGTQVSLSRVAQSLQEADHGFQGLVEAVRASVEVFAASTLLERYALTDDEARRYGMLQPLLLELFQSYQRAHPDYYEIRFLQPDGFEDTRVILGDVPNRTEFEPVSEEFRRASQAQDGLLMTLRRNPDDGHYVLSVLRRLRLPPRRTDPAQGALITRGYLSVTVSLQELQELLRHIRASDGGDIYLTNDTGTLFAGPDSPAADAGDALSPQAVQDAIRRVGTFVTARDGIQYTARSTALGMYLVARLPESPVSLAPRPLTIEVAAVTIVSILLLAWLMRSALRRHVLRPIAALQQATREIGQGNLAPRIEVASRDELGELAASVADMGHRLQQTGHHVEYLATHDSLTGLPNRDMFRDLLENALHRAQRQRQTIALLFMDIDNFKRVNDSYGHQYGDQLLIRFAERLEQCSRGVDVRARNTLSRLGGDEFLIMLESIGEAVDAGRVAQRILDGFRREPLSIGSHHYYASASIGISIFPDDGRNVDELVKNADFAMYQAKDHGRNTFQYFSNKLHASAAERLEVERRLRLALQEHRLFLLYQQQVECVSGRLVEVEALLRWDDGEHGIVGPADFITVAEETGLINDIGEWVLREALAQKLAWNNAGLGDFRLGVNLSSAQMRRGNLDRLIQDIFASSPDAARDITIELTESVLMENAEEGVRVLRVLERMGFTISLDDFGTGYSSLSTLHSLPIHVLKIDRSFTDLLPHNMETCNIVKAIIAMAHSLKIVVVAEGVETEEQLAFLRNTGCDRVQGFLIAMPVSADQLATNLLTAAGKGRGDNKTTG